jgi:ribosomal protein S18 acetylase RimI-like enzyme
MIKETKILKKGENVKIAYISEINLERLALIHLKAFKESALTELGKGAIERYYKWQLHGPHEAVALGAYQNDKLIGFCFAGCYHGSLSGFLSKNKIYLLGRLFIKPWLLGNELIRKRISQSFSILIRKKRKRKSIVSKDIQQTKSFGILALAVDPSTQKAGIGKSLMTRVERIAIERGFDQMHLTVRTNNEQAIGFYEHLGWIKCLMASWDGRMIKNLVLIKKTAL